MKHSQVKRFIDFKGVKRDNINIQLFSCEKPLKQKGQSHLFDMTKDYFSDVKILLENNDTDEEWTFKKFVIKVLPLSDI